MARSQDGPITTLEHAGELLEMVDIPRVLGPDWQRWPFALRLLAENVSRCASAHDRRRMVGAIRDWITDRSSTVEIGFTPGRLLMHDTTSTPALVDMAAMRDRLARGGRDPASMSPSLPVEISVDHSLAVEVYGRKDAAGLNVREEVRRNRERYRFLKWAAREMGNVHINPPGTGIMHTINLEQLATVVETRGGSGHRTVHPDMMLGTDSHTPMINGLGVLGWGIGGLEAETVMFGMPTSLQIPDVVGVELHGRLRPGVMATDLALVVTERLRSLGVTGAFVEFHGPGVTTLTVGERAAVANMAPEFGATTGYFPVDEHVLRYLALTGRTQQHIDLVEAYCRKAGLWGDPDATPEYTRTVRIDMDAISTSAAGPQRPQDHLPISAIPAALANHPAPCPDADRERDLPTHPVALASITSCTNTTDPRMLIAAGLLARRAREHGLAPKRWVKTSLAPGSPAAVSYLQRAGLSEDLSATGFDIVGFGCATCIGNSGPLTPEIERAQARGGVRPVAILSGNRNFPGRVHPDLDTGFLMSPPMVVAYALAGDADQDLTREPIAVRNGREIGLADLWPSHEEIDELLSVALDAQDFGREFRSAARNRAWEAVDAPPGARFPWDPRSTVLRPPPFAEDRVGAPSRTLAAHPLLVLGDDVTTDHISPASAIPRASFVADFLVERGEDRDDLNVFASRRGNWEVMVRGAFYNHALTNRLAPEAPTAHTVHAPSGETVTVWEAAQRYSAEGTPVVIIAGERFGTGSSRDWAAKAQKLLGVRAVIARSFERIHRTNLIGMGILPLVRTGPASDGLDRVASGDRVEVPVPEIMAGSDADMRVRVVTVSGEQEDVPVSLAVETASEREILAKGGVVPSLMERLEPEGGAPSAGR